MKLPRKLRIVVVQGTVVDEKAHDLAGIALAHILQWRTSIAIQRLDSRAMLDQGFQAPNRNLLAQIFPRLFSATVIEVMTAQLM